MTSQQHFIEGKSAPGLVETSDGLGTKIGKGFKDVDNIIKNGGQRGNIKYTDDGKGWLTAEVTEGPMAGRKAIWQKGTIEYLVEGKDG